MDSIIYNAGKIVDEISTPVIISNAFDNKSTQTLALWDTGATDCAITEDLVKQLNLPVVSKAIVMSVHGRQTVNVHYVKLKLENSSLVFRIPVTSCNELSEDGSIGFLIGMNLITKGDFLISNFKGETVMSFKVPSVKKLHLKNI